eukprot:TRINITY_DN24606_c0_g1_i2.p1 TRINITY_DN24606_c0_g1~~TRINITY_DN24606_c0_g1_i2.p1  ORF type:complete len:442 (+),score=10.40 TRINITY_DN24606_c0_g1_i2:228-1553(+)
MDRTGQIPDFSLSYAQAIEPDGSRYYLTNFGDESSGYLRFIIDHYESLPDITIFLHGKPEGHNPQISEWISCLKDTTWFTFLTRGYVANRCILDMKNNSLIPKYDEGAFIDFWLQFPWAELGLGSLPRCLSMYCCAEFAVSREAIRSKPLSYYKELWSRTLNFVLDQNTARKYKGWSLRQIGGIYEHSWHVMFGEPMMMQPYNHCDYYKPQCAPCASSTPSSQPLPPNHPSRRSQRGILIMDAFIGTNCEGSPAPQEISAIVDLARKACTGKNSCSYDVTFPSDVKIGRTPNTLDPNCARDYHVSWLCPNDPQGSLSRRLHIPADAMGKTVTIKCEEQVAKPAEVEVKKSPEGCPVVASDHIAFCKSTAPGVCQYETTRKWTCNEMCASISLPCAGGVDNLETAKCEEQAPLKVTGCTTPLMSQLCMCGTEAGGDKPTKGE